MATPNYVFATPTDVARDYRSDIEGLRAVAIVLVVAAHANISALAGGFIGVDVFFVLSGYLITRLLLREIEATGDVRFGAFYARRLKRLLPGLVVMLACTFGLALLLLAPNEQLEQAPAGAAAAFWASNFYFAFERLDYFGSAADSNVFLHTWSLGVEEQFYLLWPALLLAVWKRTAKGSGEPYVRRLELVLLAVFGVSMVLSLVGTYAAPRFAFYMMPARAWQFALGALVCVHLDAGRLRSHRRSPTDDDVCATSSLLTSRWCGWIGLALIVASALWLDEHVPYPGAWALAPSIGTALILAAGTRSVAHGVGRVLSLRPMQVVGRLSYAWYLWHWPILLLGAAGLGLSSVTQRLALVTLSLLVAALTYGRVESPIRRSVRWSARPGAVVAASVLAMTVSGALAARLHAHASSAIDAEEVVSRYQRIRLELPAIYSMGCDDWYHSDEVRVCMFGSESAAHTAIAVGDSIGLQWFPAIAEIFDRPDWRLLVLTKSSCPMVDQSFFYPRLGREYTECSTWRNRALAQIAALEPDIAILGSSYTYDFTQEQWTEGTARVLATLDPAVGSIYLLRATPVLPFDGPSCLTRQELLAFGGANSCSATAGNTRADNVFGWLSEAAARFPHVHVVDLNDIVCPAGRCEAERDGIVVFRDSQHLSAPFAGSLADALGSRVKLE